MFMAEEIATVARTRAYPRTGNKIQKFWLRLVHRWRQQQIVCSGSVWSSSWRLKN